MINPNEFTEEQRQEIKIIMKKAAQYIGQVLRQKGVTFTNEENTNQKCG